MRLSHIAWNVGGLTAPLVVAALTVPALMEILDKEKFGLLALAWGLVGYAGALDLGLGRALTLLLAQLDVDGGREQQHSALLTATRLTFITGSVAALVITLAAGTELLSLIKVKSTTAEELQYSCFLLAIALPAQAMSATYKGANEAFLNFKSINVLRAALGIINFAGPWLVVQWTTYLPWVIASLVVSRVAALFFYRRLALVCMQRNGHHFSASRYSNGLARQLFRFGGWVTVSSVVGPLLVQMDRFVIASVLSVTAVAVYVLPYELVTQSLILVGAISTVMFPQLTRLMREQPQAWRFYHGQWTGRVALLMAVVCVLLALILPYLLPLWIHANLDRTSIQVGQILCLGVFFNAIGVMYYTLLHAAGRADITAKAHMVELPLYLGLLLLLLGQFGIVGAAWAWVLRVIVDAVLLFFASRQMK